MGREYSQEPVEEMEVEEDRRQDRSGSFATQHRPRSTLVPDEAETALPTKGGIRISCHPSTPAVPLYAFIDPDGIRQEVVS
jgi:hypothetical protein